MSGLRAVVVLLVAVVPAAADRLVARDGSVDRVSAETAVDEAAGLLKTGRTELPLSSLYLVERDDGTLVWAADFRSRLRGYEVLARTEECEAAAALVKKALAANDLMLARLLLDRAQNAGLPAKDSEWLEKRVVALEQRSSRVPIKPSAERVREDAAALGGLYPGLLVERALHEPAGSLDRLRILREVLRLVPDHEGALGALGELAPKDFPIGDVRVWVDWELEVAARGAVLATDDEFELRRARELWRGDVYGVQAGPVLMVTPVRECQLVGRSLALGQLVDRVLSGMFGQFEARRTQLRPMTIFLYSSKEEYTTTSGTGASYADPGLLQWSAGHFNPQEGISRFYWYKDRDAERRILGTCVHELAHHWLQDRNAAYALSEIQTHPGVPGFWIMEGFPTFLQEGIFDIDTGEVWLDDERARSLDVVRALAPKGSVIDWKALYAMSKVDWAQLDPEPTIPLIRRWALGQAKLSPSRLFYEQAAATCHYLYRAEDGRHRKALLQYVLDFYRGKLDRLDIQTAFGLTPEALGHAVERWLR